MFPPREREDLEAVVWSPPLRGARPEPSAASMDATLSRVRAQRPLCFLWPSSGRIVRSRLAAKGTKGSNPRSRPCVASIDAAGPRSGIRRGGGSSRGVSDRAAGWAQGPRALVWSPPLRGARREISASSMDATWSRVRARRPVCFLWPSSGRIVRSRLAAKGTKGSNPRSGTCVASIDAAGPKSGIRRGGGSSQGASDRAVG